MGSRRSSLGNVLTNLRASAENLPGVSWVHSTQTGMAESTDGGVTWKYTGTANIDYGKTDETYWAPDVIQNNRMYHMYLSVVPWHLQRLKRTPRDRSSDHSKSTPTA